jgi:Transglycosylase SLT domain
LISQVRSSRSTLRQATADYAAGGLDGRGPPTEGLRLSRHRKPEPAPRKRRPAGTFLLALAVVAAVLGGGGYLYLNGSGGGTGADPAGAVVAAIPSSHSIALLEQNRQHLILMDAATKTLTAVGSPKLASTPVDTASQPLSGSSPSPGSPAEAPPSPDTVKAIAYNMLSSFGWDPKTEFGCLDSIWTRESGWNPQAENASGAYGIPQALPGSKMATAGADWATNPATQIKWGLGYIQGRYTSPCGAWSFWEGHGWY